MLEKNILNIMVHSLTIMIAKKCKQRLLLICLFGVLTVSQGYSQASIIVLLLGDKVASEKLYLSIDGAMNISTLPGMNESGVNVGVNYGLGVHIRLSDKWYLKPEFKPLSRKGATKIDPITSVSSEYTINKTKLKINYWDFPILLQYNINRKLWMAAGPQISFLTDANQFISGTGPDGLESSVKTNTKTFFNKTNFSFPLEAGYSFILGSEKSSVKIHLNVFVRYEYDFIEIFKDPALGSTKISLFQAGLSLPFIKSAGTEAKSGK
jgi:hypothetical protein